MRAWWRVDRWGRVAKRIALLAVIAVLATWLVGGYFVVVHPRTNRLEKADAIIVLGPPDTDGRGDYALDLALAHYSSTIAVSVESQLQRDVKGECNGRVPAGLTVLCFQADPETTQGEARQIRAYAAQFHWKRIIVVTSSYHISRARLIVERCFSGQVLMEAPHASHSIATIAYQYLYQTAAYVKAFTLTTGC